MQNKKTIYIFGNAFLSFDNVPIRLKPRLEKKFPDIVFQTQDPNENLKPLNGELVIIDTVTGPPDVVIIDDIDKIETSSSCSMHDFDLGFNLKLLRKIGELEKIKIYGVPMDMGEDEAFEKLIKLL